MKPSTIAKPGGRRKLKEKEEFLVNMVNQAKVIKANMSPFYFITWKGKRFQEHGWEETVWRKRGHELFCKYPQSTRGDFLIFLKSYTKYRVSQKKCLIVIFL